MKFSTFLRSLLLIGLVISANSFAAPVYCVGQIIGPKGVDSIWGDFSYDFWCSNGTYKKFHDYGCYTSSCHDQARRSLEKHKIASLGYKFFKQTDLDEHHKKVYVYTKLNNAHSALSSYDFTHKVTRHTGFGERTTIYVSKNNKRSEVNLGNSDGSEYLNYLFKDQPFVQKISRDEPGMQLSEFSIYLRIP